MPNHITNRIEIITDNPEILDEYLDRFTSTDEYEERCFDFNKILPQPATLSGSEEREWNYANWGTPGNAYNTVICDNVLYFDTPWVGVPELVAKTSRLFPDVELDYKFADEDCGCNLAHYTCKNGIMNKENIEEMTHRAFEIYLECKQLDIEESDELDINEEGEIFCCL